VRFAADWIPLLVGMLLCAWQPQLRYSSEASLLQTLQLLREWPYHLLLQLLLRFSSEGTLTEVKGRRIYGSNLPKYACFVSCSS
jgi:hypothetical protein